MLFDPALPKAGAIETPRKAGSRGSGDTSGFLHQGADRRSAYRRIRT